MVLGDDHRGELAVQRLRARPAKDRARLSVPLGDVAVGVDRDEGVVCGLQDLPGVALARLQGRLGCHAVGDIARRGVDQFVLRVGNRLPLKPAPPTVLVA